MGDLKNFNPMDGVLVPGGKHAPEHTVYAFPETVVSPAHLGVRNTKGGIGRGMNVWPSKRGTLQGQPFEFLLGACHGQTREPAFHSLS